MRILILGSKEYPFGDIGDSGGIEIYVQNFVENIKEKEKLIIVTRGTKKEHISGNPEIYKVPYRAGFYSKTPSFIIRSFLKSLRLDFDVIISNGEVSNFFALLLSKIKGKPIIIVSHGIASEQPQYNSLIKFAFWILERITYPLSTKTITHSPHQMGKITKKFEVINPGFNRTKLKKISDREKKELRKILGIKNEKVIIFTGRLNKVKGLEYLFYALKDFKIPYKCLIVGDGPHKNFYQNLARKMELNISFLGHQKDVGKYLSISDVFVLPSVSESLNYSMIEAAYMGVPIVVTDLKIIPDNSAIVVPKRDPESIRLAIEKIFSDDKVREKITKNAKDFTNKFDWKEATKRYLEIIRH